MSYGPQPLPRVAAPIPRCWTAMAEALRWSPSVTKTLWAVVADSQDPLLRGVGMNYVLLDQRLKGLDPDRLQAFIKSQASPRVLVRILERAVERRVLRRAQAGKLEERILQRTDKEGAWIG